MTTDLSDISSAPSIAVVMATFNGEKYIAAQLQSIAEQTLPPRVLIVSDDGSGDATLRIVGDFARRAPFPVVVRSNSQRLGYGANFLTATTAADTDLVAFCDQDDVWHPDKLAVCAAAFAEPDVVLAVHNATLIDESGRTLGPYEQGFSENHLAPPLSLEAWQLYSGFSMVFRRELLDLIPLDERGPDANHDSALVAHDRWIYFLATCTGTTALIARSLANYRQHGANLYGVNRPPRLSRLRANVRSLPDRRSRAAHYGSVASHRTQLLRDAGRRRADIAPTLERAACHWDAVARSEVARLAVYEQQSVLVRAVYLVRNLFNGTYRQVNDRRWRREAILADALYLCSIH